jgi:hypothetical protein
MNRAPNREKCEERAGQAPPLQPARLKERARRAVPLQVEQRKREADSSRRPE